MSDDALASSAPEPRPDADASTRSVAAADGAAVVEDWASRFKYLLADFENYRRRTERERDATARQSRGALLRGLLPILEAFRAARESVAGLPPVDPVRRGLDLLDREWTTFLKAEGVEPVVEIGGPFRPDEAEAVGETLPAGDRPEGTVAEIVQQGYRFLGGLLRPAKVIVVRSPRAGTPAEAPTDAGDEGEP